MQQKIIKGYNIWMLNQHKKQKKNHEMARNIQLQNNWKRRDMAILE
jgi:hypothetical protein